MSNTCLQLKGSVVTTFILELFHYTADEFTQQLQEKINQAPGFFDQSPLVISLDKLDQKITQIDLLELVSICRQNKLQPMAFRSEDARFTTAIQQTGLVHLSNASSRASSCSSSSASASTNELANSALSVDDNNIADNNTSQNSQPESICNKSRIITRPVRSGQQIYAEGADLIILSQVSAGAEVLADGNIHVYGALRGRALAGVKGDTNARVFCSNLQAELISIAGNFMLSDALQDKLWKASAQIYLDGQSLHVEAV